MQSEVVVSPGTFDNGRQPAAPSRPYRSSRRLYVRRAGRKVGEERHPANGASRARRPSWSRGRAPGRRGRRRRRQAEWRRRGCCCCLLFTRAAGRMPCVCACPACLSARLLAHQPCDLSRRRKYKTSAANKLDKNCNRFEQRRNLFNRSEITQTNPLSKPTNRHPIDQPIDQSNGD